MERKCTIALVALSMLLISCSLSDGSQTTQPKDSEGVENTTSSEMAQMKNEMLDLNHYSVTNGNQDYVQSSTSQNRVSKGKTGYYYETQEMLRLFDLDSETVVTVCNKPNCKHEDGLCVANVYLAGDNYIMTLTNQIFYNGFVYFVGGNRETQYVNLYRIAGDGTTREEYMQLFRFDASASRFRYPYFGIYRDAVYYIDNEETQPCIRRCELGKEEPTEIFKLHNSNGQLYRMRFYGDYLFFQAGISDDQGEVTGGIYAYNMNSRETKLVLNSVVSTYTVVQSRIIYTGEDGIYSYDLRTAEVMRLLESDDYQGFFSNSQYIILENLEVYTLSGDYICKLALEDGDDILGMDEEYIIAKSLDDNLLLKPISELDDKPFTEYVCED